MTEHTNGDAAEEVVIAELVEEEPLDPHRLGLELPQDPAEAQQILMRALREARAESSTFLNDLKRVAADSENFRKRMLRDQVVNIERASERVVQSLLPTLDSFDAALSIEPTTEAEEKMLQGLKRTHTQLLETLGQEGLEIIATVGEPFDPAVHEAATAPSKGEGSLVVQQELRRGYKLKGKVVRAALVAVDYEDEAAVPEESTATFEA